MITLFVNHLNEHEKLEQTHNFSGLRILERVSVRRCQKVLDYFFFCFQPAIIRANVNPPSFIGGIAAVVANLFSPLNGIT